MNKLKYNSLLDEASNQMPGNEFRQIEIPCMDGLPKAIIQVAEKVSKPEALALVNAFYQQRFLQMQDEINSLQEDKKSLLALTATKIQSSEICRNSKSRQSKYTSEVRAMIIEMKDKGDKWPKIAQFLNKHYPKEEFTRGGLSKWYCENITNPKQ